MNNIVVIIVDHRYYMAEALEEAKIAFELGEVPVGALLVREGQIIARGHNVKETINDPTGHAELIVIRQAAKELKSWRLTDTVLYVTLEPCPMCAGAILVSRIPKVVFGAFDPKAGAAGTVVNLLENGRFNHRCEVIAGVREKECKELIKGFFQNLRK